MIKLVAAVMLMGVAISQSHFIDNAFAQLPSHYRGPQDAIGLKLPIPLPSSYPPLRTDMPYAVLVGYIYFDSVVRSINIPSGQLDTLISRIGYSDTLKKALKYLYEMGDFDPIAFFQFMQYAPQSTPYTFASPHYVLSAILNKAAAVMPDSSVTASLCKVGAIMQVSVTDTQTILDTTIPTLNKLAEVTCSVDDIIKGANLPGCALGAMTSKLKSTTTVGNCLNFEYYLYSQQEIKSSDFIYNPRTLYSTSGSPWVKKGQDYIICLDLIGLGSDKTHAYVSLMPGFGTSTMMGVYPISNGIVQDPNNDFGIGTGLSVADFKARLRQKIQTIITP